MRRVFLEDAKPGDEVAEPVVSSRGVVILTKGSALTLALIGRMRKMGIAEVLVEGDDPDAPPPEELDEALKELDARFEGLEENRLMMMIKRISRQHVLDRAST